MQIGHSKEQKTAHVIYKAGDDPEKNVWGMKMAMYIVNLINNLFELCFNENALICPNFIVETIYMDPLFHKSYRATAVDVTKATSMLPMETVCYRICG